MGFSTLTAKPHIASLEEDFGASNNDARVSRGGEGGVGGLCPPTIGERATRWVGRHRRRPDLRDTRVPSVTSFDGRVVWGGRAPAEQRRDLGLRASLRACDSARPLGSWDSGSAAAALCAPNSATLVSPSHDRSVMRRAAKRTSANLRWNTYYINHETLLRKHRKIKLKYNYHLS